MFSSILPIERISIDNGGLIDQHFELNHIKGLKDYIQKRFKKQSILDNYGGHGASNFLSIKEEDIPSEDLKTLEQTLEILGLLITEGRVKKEEAYIPFPTNNQVIFSVKEEVDITVLKDGEILWKFNYSPYVNEEIEQTYYYSITPQGYIDCIKLDTSSFTISKQITEKVRLIGTELIISDKNLTENMKRPYIKVNNELKTNLGVLDFTITEEETKRQSTYQTFKNKSSKHEDTQESILTNPAIVSNILP